MLSVRKFLHLRSSETETSLDPSEDHTMRNIEPSCPISLLILAALYCWQCSWTELENELFKCIPSSKPLLKGSALSWGTTFQIMICRNTSKNN